MQMTDLSFLLYFLPGMLLVYFALSFSRKAQNLWLVVCSLLLYAMGSILYMLLLIVWVMVNFYLGFLAQRQQKARKPDARFFILAVGLNLLPLIVFAHLPPIAESVAGLLGLEAPAFPAAPLGVAFLALQGISYVVDIARGKAPWSPRFTDAALYLAFFPPLQAGPLLRYQDIAPQIQDRRTRLDQTAQGVGRLVVGLAKVVLLSGALLRIADIVFDMSGNSGVYATVPISLALLGLVAYAIGLYHFLSGFSDLVIGLGKILGFTYPENFNYPILASSVTLFWKRCYISLRLWFEEYIYGPLGKRRANNDHMVRHLLLMWLLIGLWTGPGLTGILFGLISFLFILLERIIELKEVESRNPLRHLYVLLVVLLSLVALRTQSIYQFTLYISNLFGMRGSGFQSGLALLLLKESWYVLVLGLICCFPIGARLRQRADGRGHALSKAVYAAYPVAMVALFVVLIISLSHAGYNPGQVAHLRLWR